MRYYVVQTLMGSIGAVGFAVLFNVPRKQIHLIAIASAVSWVVYLACVHAGLGIFFSMFWSTVTASGISEILARVVKAPVLLFLVPVLIPTIPGKDLYQMMSCLVRGQYRSVLQVGQDLGLQALAIAFGITVVASIMRILITLVTKLRGQHRTSC